ncbi:MAG: methylenetetrahydrofolate--tRNA-(uracil(54)-C(5))-methyltransferase (FADH(2)-oxidizing) TrmFO [Anaerolineae bacterium]|jgi:methylenetetrahydrofolate--tRNA-(uracil-5-)-methyltransferase
MVNSELTIIGGGLAGSEAAWQAAERGVQVTLYEMRPLHNTPAHVSGWLAELVCSNSMGARSVDRAMGLLKEEMRRLGSLIIACAEAAAVPAGAALAVDREIFAEAVTARIMQHPNIELRRQEVTYIPDGPTIIATGPLTSDALAEEIVALTGENRLSFFDAMAPIVEAESINMDVAFRASRYGRGEQNEGDYINCPMTEEEYDAFVDALLTAEVIPLRDFEREDQCFFEACLPIEVLAARGRDALAFGPLRPVGLTDPRTGRRPYAVVQLRQDNLAATLYNIVGFQTNLRWGEQKRVFHMIPGLQSAEFMRYGQMHRNTFINSPTLLDETLRYQGDKGLGNRRIRDSGDGDSRTPPDSLISPLWFAGQVTGTEGYVGSAMGGLVAGLNAVRFLQGQAPLVLPETTMIGALLRYISHADPKDFQPMKANFGLMPPLEKRVRRKRERYQAYARRALTSLQLIIDELEVIGRPTITMVD